MATLGQLIERHGGLIQTGPFGSQLKQKEYVEAGVPVVMPKDIKDGQINEGTIARVSEEKADALSRHKMRLGTIVFPRRGEISKCALITEQNEGFLCGTGCLKIEVPASVINPKYLYFYLSQRHIVEWLERNAVGTTMLNLNTSIMGGVEFTDVPIAKQNEIAGVLSNYDDLIENNRRRIQLLEESARLLYKEWFVQLRFPGHEHVKVVDGVPEGWGLGCIGDMAEVKSGFAFKSKDWLEEGNPVIKIKNITESGNVGLDGCQCVDDNVAEKAARFELSSGNMLIAMTGATVGKVGLMPRTVKRYFLNQRVGKYFSKQTVNPIPFLFCFSKTQYFSQNILNLAGGAAQPNISGKQIESIETVVPDMKIVDWFNDHVTPFFDQRETLLEQNNRLAQARDILLPRLMNGTLTV